MISKFNLFVSLLLFGFNNYAQPVQLRLRLNTGQTYNYNSDMSMQMNQQINGQNIDIVMNLNGNLAFVVKEFANDTYLLEAAYKKLAMSMKMPQATITFSSNNPAGSDPVSMLFAQIIDQPFMISMSSRGEIVGVNGLEKLFQSMIDSLNLPEQQKQQVRSQMQQSFGNEAFISNFQLGWIVFPQQAVSQGSSWEFTTTMTSTGVPIEVNTTHTYLGMQDGKWHIRSTSTLSKPDDQEWSNFNGLKAKITVNGTQEGDILLDSSSGWVQQSTVDQQLEMTFTIPPNDQLPNGLTIPMTMKTKAYTSN